MRFSGHQKALCMLGQHDDHVDLAASTLYEKSDLGQELPIPTGSKQRHPPHDSGAGAVDLCFGAYIINRKKAASFAEAAQHNQYITIPRPLSILILSEIWGFFLWNIPSCKLAGSLLL